MASPHKPRSLNSQAADTLEYFDKYDYPLTKRELWLWHSLRPTNTKRKVGHSSDYYFLSGRAKLVEIRAKREKYSQQKWLVAKRVGEKLKRIPFIAAVFVTGALAMNNTPIDDDIDLMIVTFPHTLWVSRFLLNLYLSNIRRYPWQKKAPNKICPNLWIDTNNLSIADHDLYHAHEVLQVRPLWDIRGGVPRFFKQQSLG